MKCGDNFKASIILQNGGDDYFTQTGGASDGFITLIKSLDYDYGRSVFALNVTVTVSNWKLHFRAVVKMVWGLHIFLFDLTGGIHFKPDNTIFKCNSFPSRKCTVYQYTSRIQGRYGWFQNSTIESLDYDNGPYIYMKFTKFWKFHDTSHWKHLLKDVTSCL